MTTFLFFFCWIFLQFLTQLTTKFSSPAWTLILAFSLLHSSGFSHISLTDISPLQSITRLRYHHSSSTACLRAQYWGPVLFVLYTTPLSGIIANRSVNRQLFADDTQLQKSAPLSEVTNLTKELNACTDDINNGWPKISLNLTTINDDKTEALLFPFSSSLKPSTVSRPDSVTLGNIPFSDSASNLGVILDSNLSTKKHVIKVVKLLISSLKALIQSAGFSLTLVTSHILSRLDYCNCLLMGTPNSVIKPLQKIINFAARLVLLEPRHHHATPLQEKQHWLPISERVKYRVRLYVFQCYKWYWSCLPLWTATCLHSVSCTTLFCWHPHAENPAIQTEDSWLSHFLLLWTPHLEFTPTRP